MNELSVFMDFSDPVFQLLIAALLGAFVGLRRELELQKKNISGFRGLRTSSMVTMLGSTSTFFPDFEYLPVVFLIALLVGVIMVYRHGLKKGLVGMTSEISLILLFLSGVFIGYEEFVLGIVLALLVAISDAYKDTMHSFAKKLKLKEWSGTLQMILISLVMLPFLPRESIDPWGIIIPYNIWILVILVTGIGFIGYFLNKFFKNSKLKGVYLTSFLGSLVSSTVVTVGLSQKISKKEKIPKYFIPSILLAITVMEFRSLIIILFASNYFSIQLILTPLIMGVVSLILFIWFFLKDFEKKEINLNLEEKSPFEIFPALKFATLFIVVLFLVDFIKRYFGDTGIYLTTFVVSLVDTETIILPGIESFKNGTIDLKLLGHIITISIVVNTFVKLAYIQFFAGKKAFKKTLIPIIILSILGLIPLVLF